MPFKCPQHRIIYCQKLLNSGSRYKGSKHSILCYLFKPIESTVINFAPTPLVFNHSHILAEANLTKYSVDATRVKTRLSCSGQTNSKIIRAVIATQTQFKHIHTYTSIHDGQSQAKAA